ncbi:uncharacterized protein LOC120418924 [Culex pipiens pallens]|uniref:uncharacterized protein LOC120418924 n=1 Tax=Culex pipiens pallens TaxID=42434 RepID=UPI0019548846|nr:uncharacterized protein LOC120418924 [Culex pipiens pallens]
MSKPVRLASFCRLCLVKSNASKVSIFEDQSGSVLDLLKLIELEINATEEPNAVICFECVVTLEGFQQFKEQCHTNDEFLKTVPPAGEGEEEEEDAASCASSELSCHFLEDDPIGVEEEGDDDGVGLEILNADSEPEEGLVLDEEEVCDEPKAKKAKVALKKSVPKLDLEEIDRQCKEHNIKVHRKVEGPTLDDLQVLKDSYPDYFYFEKGTQARYYKLVFYGERFHVSNFTERYTYWMCMHRKKRNCPAQICVRNDYGEFERRHEHNHGELKEKEGKAFTPRQALPELFEICRSRVLHKTAMRRKKILERKLKELEEGPDTDEEVNSKPAAGLKRVLRQSGVMDGLEESDDGESDEWNE